MKASGLAAFLALVAYRPATSAGADGPRAVTKVVKLLEGMLAKSKADGDEDRKIYAKFLCYCNTNKEEKTEEIASLAKEISVLESKIDELQGANGELSSSCAKLKSDMSANKLAQQQAASIRGKESEAFTALRADLTTSIGLIGKSIQTLGEVGADQTLGQAAADHTKFMAGYKPSLLKLRTRIREALSAASAFLGAREKVVVDSFLQAPFTGTYTAQSGEVVGILKDMKDTFARNLATATATEQQQVAAYEEFINAKVGAYDEMLVLYNVKQKLLGQNDDELATKRQQLDESIKQKDVDEAFLAEMIPMCDEKSKEYKERNMLRANEDAALAEAIAILNKDSAFSLFGKVKATSAATAFFLQTAEIRQHLPEAGSVKWSALHLLQAAGKSLRLAKVAALIEADNPFTVVLDEIEKMLVLIKEEATVDAEKLKWCTDERTRTDTTIKEKGEQIIALEGKINELTDEIAAPETGLKAQIQSTEDSLQENESSQKSQTAMRLEENLAYEKNIGDIVKAEELLGSAIKVLSKYYQQLDKYQKEEADEVENLPGEESARPGTWESEKGYKGQSVEGRGAISMLEFILGEAKKEEAQAHSAEASSQQAFEDSMKQLKDEEAELQSTLTTRKQTLAEKEAELLETKDDLKDTTAAKEAAEAYLLEIKPGCDFVTENYDVREAHRAAESKALEKARELLKGTPAYKASVAAAELESLGSCKDICENEGREQAKCKACLAKVTVPGYCAGHPETSGC